jgi:hypothetical protein
MAFAFKAVSGLGPKEAAAFLLEIEGLRLLLDLGADSSTGAPPDPRAIGRVDAVVISHAHKDHVGGLSLLPAIGDPLVYATESVLARLSVPAKGRPLPVHGRGDVLGIPVETGRDGHALGGIWVRFAVDGGFLYMGDHSAESNVFAFDVPPATATMTIDASYGEAAETRAAQVADILRMSAERPTLFPVPADGRGIEMALFLAAEGRRVAIDDAVRRELRRLAGPDRAFAKPGTAEAAGRLAADAPDAADPATKADAFIAADGSGGHGVSKLLIETRGDALAVVYTGHLPKGTRGQIDVAAGRAGFRRWNVHPTLPANAALVAEVGAKTVIPAFGDPKHRDAWSKAFAPAVIGPAPEAA